MNSRTKWLFLAVGGLMLNGFGLSLLAHAALIKYATPEQWLTWVPLGTIAIASVNAGICLVVEAGRTKPRY